MATGVYTKTNSTEAKYGENSGANKSLQEAINKTGVANVAVDSKYGDQTKSAVDKLSSQGYTYKDGSFVKADSGSSGSDSSGSDVSGETSNSPKVRMIYTDENGGASTGPSTEEVQAKMMSEAQGSINNLNEYYDTLVNENKVLGEKNLRSTNAINVMAGLSGSTEGAENVAITNKSNKAEVDKINAERATKINEIINNVRTNAITESKNLREEARLTEQDRLTYREKAQTEAVNNLSLLSKTGSGVTLEGLKKTLSENEYNTLIKNAGGEEMAKAIIFENRAKNTVLGNPTVMGNKVVQAYQTPDGKVKYEEVSLPAGVNPVDVKAVEKTDSGIYIIKSDGTYSKIAGSGSGNGVTGSDAPLYAGLNGATATAVRARVSAFKSEPIVTNFNVINEGYNFAKSMSSTTTNPADDQALIYAFAKIMDPNSVVREGEYATAQKYVQSWIDAYGKGVGQALLGTGFLTTKARENIKNVIETKYKASEQNYKNVYNNYASNINNLTGRKDGSRFLVDYSGAYSNSGTQVEYQGKIYNVDENGDMTPVE